MADTKATAAATTMDDGDLRTAYTGAMEIRDAAWMIENGTGIQDSKLALLDERVHLLGDELRRRHNGKGDETMTTATEERTAQRIGHAQRLLDAMGGSPEGWEYTGEILEGDPSRTKCACGHPIRWMFIWENAAKNRKLTTGSVCVENLPGITETYITAMKADLEAAIAAKRAAAKKAREAAAQIEVTALRESTLARIDKIYEWAMRNQEAAQGAWLAGGTYAALQDRRYYRARVLSAGKLKTARGQINRLREVGEGLDNEQKPEDE